MRIRIQEIKTEMTINEIEKALWNGQTFETNYNGSHFEFTKPDVRNRHNNYYWVIKDGQTMLKKARIETVLERI